MTIRIRLMSDLHVDGDWEFDRGVGIGLTACATSDIDVLVLAGDVGEWDVAKPWLDTLDANVKCPVLYVPGNHEFWFSSIAEVEEELNRVATQWKNIKVMNRRVLEIAGQRFVGAGVMWYPQPKSELWGDYNFIKDFRARRQSEYEATREFLEKELKEGDIVISHMIPCMEGVHSRWIGEWSNMFFLSDHGDLIQERKPKAWLYGHTHDRIRRRLDNGCFLITNPRAYPNETQRGEFEQRLVIVL